MSLWLSRRDGRMVLPKTFESMPLDRGEMLYGAKDSGCLPPILFAVNVVLACVDGAIGAVALSQLLRIHLRSRQIGWTRQKVVHLLLGTSNIGYLLYFLLSLVAACKRWSCWGFACGFIWMAWPQILFLAAFLLLLSFWIDLCHQANDEEEEDEDNCYSEALLEKSMVKPGSLHADDHWKCCPLRGIHVGSRQRLVILVSVLVFVLMIGFALLIWIGKGKGPIDSSVVARVYLDLFSIAILLLGGALACYGLLLYLKMSRVRSERTTEMWKVGGLAVVSLVCFTSCAIVALATNVPMLFDWDSSRQNCLKSSLLTIVYYFIGLSVPSAFVLWVMREMPPQIPVGRQVQSRIVTYIRDNQVTFPNSQRWTAATSSQNQALKSIWCKAVEMANKFTCVCLEPIIEAANFLEGDGHPGTTSES